MSFDIKAEAHIWINAILHAASRTPWKQDQLEDLLTRCHDAAALETEEADIKDCCRYCERGLPLVRNPHLGLQGGNTNPPEFWYQHTKEKDPDFKVYCSAANIHERRRIREEQG